MNELTERIRGYDGVSERYQPIRSLDDVRTHYQKANEVVWDILKEVGSVARRVDWEKMDTLAESAIEKIVEIGGAGMIREWEVYLRSKDVPEEDLDARLPGIVEDVYGSMVEYGNYGQSLIDLSKSLRTLLKKKKFSLLEKCTVKLYLSGIEKSFEKTGKHIKGISKV